ncbi:glycosyltransferase family 2 protein [Methylobacterium gossipiicola]|uniref:Glycosyltransferase involved in cell wall bisynthesis n=1 Tax=Methylobacterium gossipiicola TaxID=582675 RepID=A0A1I2TN57_9HYPH|nr:glycosyltransferase [Methylobacterium gossipiicola]KQO89464.1 hypothetical protein ASF36_23020 [Methylobacterium sp. Leaf90]SFG66352.1 Glycosyltransferase involved in cell wall bisynthesis [Methylobacterium gossipiicola]
MLAAIVIPCLNERDTIPNAARSLGFGLGDEATPDGALLVLVDNGSTDGTRDALTGIGRTSRRDAVVVIDEAERGYVPPRAAGVEAAACAARARGVPSSELLIVQGDADTIYHEGYVRAFRSAAEDRRPALFEGLTHPPHRFLEGHPGYQRLADAIDEEMRPFLVDDTLDVMVDDKVCGYSLASYRDWGGHRREYRSDGREIHAETSRLFLRGKAAGAIHFRLPHAEATPSRRKILRNPIRHFATGGFPRDEAWWRSWSRGYSGPRGLPDFEREDARTLLMAAVAMRKAHLLALMSALPLMVAGQQELATARRAGRLHHLVDQFFHDMGQMPAQTDVPTLFDVVLEAAEVWQNFLGGPR